MRGEHYGDKRGGKEVGVLLGRETFLLCHIDGQLEEVHIVLMIRRISQSLRNLINHYY